MRAFIIAFLILASVLCITSLVILVIDMTRDLLAHKKQKQAKPEQVTAETPPTTDDFNALDTVAVADGTQKRDPILFLEGLTDEERTAFLNFFSKKRFAGVPVYTLGKDNEKFFKRVCMYYNDFSAELPEGLAEKICEEAETYLIGEVND